MYARGKGSEATRECRGRPLRRAAGRAETSVDLLRVEHASEHDRDQACARAEQRTHLGGALMGAGTREGLAGDEQRDREAHAGDEGRDDNVAGRHALRVLEAGCVADPRE